ncbi:16S rRNA (guanine(527)-N(7))-methyltransferase RsmG [Spiroplasma platyhelix]|uniref:Ribosomal RNA small subunit methyltransferase G n=1 Tax=Spiroplasma platyhelix PALS-1 TaxID=1276218 RepID=A0A846U1C6_9MOLU|nr:16S rRNA (guanine(527)-N(7))-methyltransferase RsmG [Spiroplasma platyhelix]MBE4704243.1 Ribosomal RNA small subunit methyltransferase G [Spiroplasma platyhelix PALS-1]NKE38616.1 16S rRNA (guanine(527)-N(7))-methyltransferase RsmG [Spiroplasma platyhelix PALS-1]UJB28827.1 16S rRNA (guanine527-N7)-methyltransferase [Spiroplasma platyhelix PALS-1]
MNSDWSLNLKNFQLTNDIKTKLEKYYELIIEYNQKFNLTTITEKEEVYYKHFYDTLLISNEVALNDQTICDVGSGLGVPGIVLKICFPNLQLTMIESNSKKCQFLEVVVQQLKLENVYIVNQRVEEFAHKYRETFDLVVARAVAPLNILNELCLPLVKVSGFFIAYKGLNIESELQSIKSGLKIIGAELIKQATYQLPKNYGTRNLLIFKKQKLTPLKYPRIYQQIKNKPL